MPSILMVFPLNPLLLPFLSMKVINLDLNDLYAKPPRFAKRSTLRKNGHSLMFEAREAYRKDHEVSLNESESDLDLVIPSEILVSKGKSQHVVYLDDEGGLCIYQQEEA